MFVKIIYGLAFLFLLWGGLLVEIQTTEEKEKQAEEIVRIRLKEKVIEKIPSKYRSQVVKLCKKHKIPIHIIYNLVKQESEWRAYTTSSYNYDGSIDRGLFQLNSRYLTCFSQAYFGGKPINPYDAEHSITVGIRMLAYYKKVFKGNWRKVLYSYNWGIGNVIYNRYVPITVRKYADKILSEDPS